MFYLALGMTAVSFVALVTTSAMLVDMIGKMFRCDNAAESRVVSGLMVVSFFILAGGAVWNLL